MLQENDPKLLSWLTGAQGIINAYFVYMKFDLSKTTKLSLQTGQRYIKVIAESYAQKSVWAFIDRTNGDVLKAASWKAPAKHARGNINDEHNGLKYVGAYGPAYLR